MLGETTFTLSGMDNFSKDVYLIDNYLEKTIKITNLTEYVYTFTNQVAGIQEDRFQLKLAPAGTSIESVEDALYLRAWIEGDEIRILSSPGNPIKSLALYDMQGRVIYATDSVDAFDYTSAIHLPDRQVYILSIVTEKTIKRIKIVK